MERRPLGCRKEKGAKLKVKVILEDGFAVEKGTGIGQHTLNLLKHLGSVPELVEIQAIEKPFLKKVPSAALRRALYMVWLNSGLQLHLQRIGADVIHFTNYLLPSVKLSPARYVATIHDLTAYQFPEVLPSNYSSYIRWATSLAVRSADLVLTVSDAVKEEIVEIFGVDRKKIRTIHNGIAKGFWETPKEISSDRGKAVRAKFLIKRDFLLFVGTIEERKNLMPLVRAFERLKGSKELQLVLVGRPGYGFSKLNRYLQEHDLKADVILTGYVTEEDLISLYDQAKLFVYPSLYEGFGIPLVEAMARGVPIVASRIPATEEVAGGAAVYYNDPSDHRVLADRVCEALEGGNLRRELSERGLERARDFSWDAIGKRYLKAYHDACKGEP